MSSDLPSVTRTPFRGFRLHRLEVSNWGTFDSHHPDHPGRITSIETDGETALLIGRNGSGKSTLVDSLLTLLVRPAVRNYNVAAGAAKRERDERSYIRGAYDRRSRSDESGGEVLYLRPGNSHYSVLLACFCNAASGRWFTLAQVLSITADGKAEKIYCFADRESSITRDFSGLKRGEVAGQLKEAGFRTTKIYSEYHEWFRRVAGFRGKAMDMLNQTVAVRDIQRLNDFIRDHMLESRSWGKTVDSLLTHFSQLSESHRSLIRVRDQLELLEPIEATGGKWRSCRAELESAEQQLLATDAFFCQQTLEVFQPESRRYQNSIQEIRQRREQVGRDINKCQQQLRRVENEIESAGGLRLSELPRLIADADQNLKQRQKRRTQLETAASSLGSAAPLTSERDLIELRRQLESGRNRLDHSADCQDRREELLLRNADLKEQAQEIQSDLTALQQQGNNVPRQLIEVRQTLCDQLELSTDDLPFAAEMISVSPAEKSWEASVEMLLRRLGLSLLVPDRIYRKVSRYIDNNRLEDTEGAPQKLEYIRVRHRQRRLEGSVADPESMIGTLQLRETHALFPWVEAELHDHYDYRCCESLEDFQAFHGPAMTRDLHVRNEDRHIKDDRQHTNDRAGFILGWENQEKRTHLNAALTRIQQSQSETGAALAQLRKAEQQVQKQLKQLDEALQISAFADIDVSSAQSTLQQLQQEKQDLEAENDTARVLRDRHSQLQSDLDLLMQERDALGVREGEAKVAMADADARTSSAAKMLEELENAGRLEQLKSVFSELHVRLGDTELLPENFAAVESEFRRTSEHDCQRLRNAVQPIETRLLREMSRFLVRFPEARGDLDPSPRYLDSFLELLRSIRADDLPRHEQRFRERLNEKVARELGLLNSELEKERFAIEDRIAQLNSALMQLEYRSGSHMQLVSRPVQDSEITEFRQELHACMEESATALDEAKFERIQKLINRLQSETRWRSKVVDVRRWFDFAAQELDATTGNERSYYEDSTGQSGGEKAKLAFTILVAAIAYQYDIDPDAETSDRFHFVVVDEMFSRIDDQYAEYALDLFQRFGLQLLIVAPLDAKARVTERHVGRYLLVTRDQTGRSNVHTMSARELAEQAVTSAD